MVPAILISFIVSSFFYILDFAVRHMNTPWLSTIFTQGNNFVIVSFRGLRNHSKLGSFINGRICPKR